jgi:hypothetical protein
LATRASRGATIWWSICGIFTTWIFRSGGPGRGVRFRLGGPRGFRAGEFARYEMGGMCVYGETARIWVMSIYSTFSILFFDGVFFYAYIFATLHQRRCKAPFSYATIGPTHLDAFADATERCLVGSNSRGAPPLVNLGSRCAAHHANPLCLHIDSSLSVFPYFYLYLQFPPSWALAQRQLSSIIRWWICTCGLPLSRRSVADLGS